MPLVRNGRITDDSFARIADEDPLPEQGAVLLPAARLLADTQDLHDRSGAIGVIWPNDRNVSELEPALGRLALIALVFPTFRDGRAYTQARILRERYRYRGELRATGQVLRDQFLLLHRAGFDSYDVAKPADATAFVEAVTRYSVFYQPGADNSSTASTLRASAADVGGLRSGLRVD